MRWMQRTMGGHSLQQLHQKILSVRCRSCLLDCLHEELPTVHPLGHSILDEAPQRGHAILWAVQQVEADARVSPCMEGRLTTSASLSTQHLTNK